MFERLFVGVADSFSQLVARSFTFRWLVTLLLGVAIAWGFNLFVSRILIRVIKFVSQRVDNSKDSDRLLRWRRLETSLSVVLAAVKIVLSGFALYVAWRIFNPTSTSLTVVGASALIVVIASATVGPLLRDFTYGIIMVAERWYNVGDIIVVEPFMNLSGVVEQVTLRATKLRSLSGEVIWLHNQHIQGVRITPQGSRSLSIEVFVSDLEAGRRLVEDTLAAVPTGPTMVVKPFVIVEAEQVSSRLWHIKAQGKTAPGREWLIENFAVGAIKEKDQTMYGDKSIIVHGPIVLFSDDVAERRFKRSVRANGATTK